MEIVLNCRPAMAQPLEGLRASQLMEEMEFNVEEVWLSVVPHDVRIPHLLGQSCAMSGPFLHSLVDHRRGTEFIAAATSLTGKPDPIGGAAS